MRDHSFMTPNDTITTTRVRLNRGERANPYQRGTSEWAAWEAGYSEAMRGPLDRRVR